MTVTFPEFIYTFLQFGLAGLRGFRHAQTHTDKSSVIGLYKLLHNRSSKQVGYTDIYFLSILPMIKSPLNASHDMINQRRHSIDPDFELTETTG